MTLPYKSTGWQTAPISCTCEYLDALKDGINAVPKFCGEPTDFAYPTQGGGWMALCGHHGKHHLPHIFPIEKVIESGEVFEAWEQT